MHESCITNCSVGASTQLDELVAQLSARVEAGEPIDLVALTADCPHYREQLEMLLPTLQAVVDLEHSIGARTVSLATPSRGVGQPHGDSQQEESVAGQLGDFRILREVGRGGMGIVYEAEQISLGRRVALKVLPFAAMLDKQQLARFKNEARAAATLDHPNIVAIHSVGVDRGVHYYAMQLVEGQSLAQMIDGLRARSKEQEAGREVSGIGCQVSDVGTEETAPVARLSTLPDYSSSGYFRAIARLGIQAAEALDHAHQNGILHRDIKPANLLVDDTGKLWITDFGLARMDQDSVMTMTGDLLGTLRYMSPEQALAKRVVVDHRSDIYSLGVTLYELLTLRPPFDGDDRQELLRQIAFDEPKKPRQTNSRIPQDVETIVLKAIEKNPDQRYATAAELAADMRRYLDHEPIKATPPTWRDDALKWFHRHPAIIRAAALFLVATSIISAISVLLVSAAFRREATSARLSRAAADAERYAKEAELVQRKRAEAISGFLVDAFRLAEQGTDGRTVTVAELLDRAAGTLQRRFTDDPQTKAALLAAVGGAYHGLELYEDEVPLHEEAHKLCVDALGPDHPESLRALNALCIAYWAAGRMELMPRARELVERRQRTLGPEHPDTLHSIIFLAAAYARDQEQVDDAITLIQEALKVQKSTLGPEHPDSIRSMCRLAQLYVDVGRRDEATVLLEDATQLMTSNPIAQQSFYTTYAVDGLAKMYLAAGRSDEAIELFQDCVKFRTARWGASHAATLRAINALADAHHQLRAFDQAATEYERALQLEQAEKLATGRPETLETIGGLIGVRFEQGRPAEAVKTLRDAVGLLRDQAPAWNKLAWWLATAPNSDSRNGRLAVEVALKACELTDYKVAGFIDTLAAAHAESGDFERAVEWSEKSIRLADNETLAHELGLHLVSFQAHKPWREKSDYRSF